MDTLTHALSGALLARATEPKHPRPDQLPRRARLWVGFWAAAFPDSDFLTRFIDPLTYLTVHRGITHSVILLPLWALGLPLLFMLLARKKYSWRAFLGVTALAISIHIAGDVITAFGTMIFAPFSTWRAQLPLTFIIDPYFTAIIVTGLLTSALWRAARKPAIIALAVLAGYVGFQGLLHQRAVAAGEAYAARHELVAGTIEAIPQPFSPFHWMIVIPQQQEYRLAYVSLWRDAIPEFPPEDANWLRQVNASYYPVRDAVWNRVPRFGEGKDARMAEELWYSQPLTTFRDFAQFPALYGVDRIQGKLCVWFNDLRFALAGRTMPFRYGACRTSTDTAWRVHRLINDDNGREIFEAIPH